jgi:hypothetical protein
MQLVIEISDGLHNNLGTIKNGSIASKIILDCVRKGTPLPKGHGRIGDLDALERNMIGGIKSANFEEGYADYEHINNVDDCVDCVRYADTIIEADKEGE